MSVMLGRASPERGEPKVGGSNPPGPAVGLRPYDPRMGAVEDRTPWPAGGGVLPVRSPDWEREIGIEQYFTDREPCGGRIKEEPEDFVVEEEGPLGVARVLLLRGEKAPHRPEGSGEFLWVVLEKRDWDTIDALRRIARALHVSVKRISFAGTKDKRALTAQWISLRGVRWKNLEELHLKDIAFHTPVYMRKRLRLGDLRGNHFRVRVRGARCLWIPSRFPNFFGHQRFGSYRFVSHVVGKKLLEGDYEGAVMEYLTRTSPWEGEETREARERLRRELDFKEALGYFPRRLRIERRLLSALASGKDYRSAILSLHRRTISLFIHAYQSYIFNRILSRRLEHGLDPFPGDVLVLGVPTALVPGFRSELASGLQGEIEREILDEEGVDLGAFRAWKKFGAEGGRRRIYEVPGSPHVSGEWLSFFLPKGTYATALLREVIKPRTPLGFIIPAREWQGGQGYRGERL